MNDGFTIHNQNDIYDYCYIDFLEEAIDYLINPDSFRSFGKGLTELLIKKGYSGDTTNVKELSTYLIERLRKINSSIGAGTVNSWFSGNHSPKIEAGSRNKIYEICFALELSYEETVWFFQHVYYDRAFNCHTITEAIYYYCFLHNQTYTDAQEIIQYVENAPTLATDSEETANYTQFVKNHIGELQSVAELKEFLIQNKQNFNSWNKSALKTLNKLVLELLGPPESKTTIDTLRQTINKNRNKSENKLTFDLSDYQNCGLLIRELLFDSQNPLTNTTSSPAQYIYELIENKNIQKNNFILIRSLETTKISRKSEKVPVPYIVRNNFPSRKIISDVLSEDKVLVSKSYDSIRKMIILLDFCRFWITVKLENEDNNLSINDSLSEIYLEETNACLYQCGYEELYAGNPYDWIFLCCARSDNPLEYFRLFIGELWEKESNDTEL